MRDLIKKLEEAVTFPSGFWLIKLEKDGDPRTFKVIEPREVLENLSLDPDPDKVYPKINSLEELDTVMQMMSGKNAWLTYQKNMHRDSGSFAAYGVNVNTPKSGAMFTRDYTAVDKAAPLLMFAQGPHVSGHATVEEALNQFLGLLHRKVIKIPGELTGDVSRDLDLIAEIAGRGEMDDLLEITKATRLRNRFDGVNMEFDDQPFVTRRGFSIVNMEKYR